MRRNGNCFVLLSPSGRGEAAIRLTSLVPLIGNFLLGDSDLLEQRRPKEGFA